MAIQIPELPTTSGGYRILIEPATWAGYKQVLADLDSQGRRYRSTYSDGILEVLVPGTTHESLKTCIARLLETFSLARGMEITGLGSTTFNNELKLKGLEPDEGYYINRSPQPGADELNDEDDLEPPDLAIEVDVTSSSLPREPVYAAIGVPEIWRWKSGKVQVLQLVRGKYKAIERSRVIPSIDLTAFARFVKMALKPRNQSAAAAKWFEWVKKNHA